MEPGLLLGIDVGTSCAKIGLHDDRGRCLKIVTRDYALMAGAPGEYEIDPEALWQSIAAELRRLAGSIGDVGRVEAISVCGMMIMPVLLDESGKPVRPVIHWQDQRLYAQFAALKESAAAKSVVASSGSMLTGEATINALSWVREHEPERFRRVSSFAMIKDFVRYRLTGALGTDYGDASGTMLLDARTLAWNESALRGLGFGGLRLPALSRPEIVAGSVSREAARLTGLPEGTPVAVGTGDGICTILGLGVVEDGALGITIGTAGVVGTVAGSPPIDERRRNYLFCHPVRGKWYSVMATAASGDVLRWYKDEFLRFSGGDYAALEEEASGITPDLSDVLFLPYILGSRNPHGNPEACGAFIGLRKTHSRGHVTRAVLEGILLEVADLVNVQAEIVGDHGRPQAAASISGGIVKSRFWLRMLADILGRDLVVPEAVELGTLGCAMLAAVSIGRYGTIEAAARAMSRVQEVVHFDGEAHELYRKRLACFKNAYYCGIASAPPLMRP